MFVMHVHRSYCVAQPFAVALDSQCVAVGAELDAWQKDWFLLAFDDYDSLLLQDQFDNYPGDFQPVSHYEQVVDNTK